MHARHLSLIVAIATASGMLGAFVFQNVASPSQEDLIKEFYDIENAVYASPHSVRKHIGDGMFILVDLRSREEYETAHIVGAISVPAYSDPDTSDYGAVERITSSFRALQEANPGKEIIVYCYSMPCMTGRKIGKMLADHGIYVKHLGIGWQEWRYYWNLWNHDGEVQVDPSDYIASGSEPGTMPGERRDACPIDGAYGC